VNSTQVERLLESSGAIRHGHFQLSSGLHSGFYCQCARLLESPQDTEQVCRALAEQTCHLNPNVVAAPALGGIVLGYELARQLNARSIFVERDADGRFALRRFSLGPGARVLVAEDVITTGLSTRETIDVVRQAGGEVVAVAAILDRSGGQAEFDVPCHALYTRPVENYTPDDCPLCRQGLPLEKPGSRPAGKEA
jgi:orotate phosphoribosyltransferase